MKKFHAGVELANRNFSLHFDELKINSNIYRGLLATLLKKEDEKLSPGRRGIEQVLVTMQEE